VPAALPEVPVGGSPDGELLGIERHDRDPQRADQVIELSAQHRVTSAIDHDARLEQGCRADPRVACGADGLDERRSLRLTRQDRDQGRAVDDHAGRPCSS
jgi:hypothetical protein